MRSYNTITKQSERLNIKIYYRILWIMLVVKHLQEMVLREDT